MLIKLTTPVIKMAATGKRIHKRKEFAAEAIHQRRRATVNNLAAHRPKVFDLLDRFAPILDTNKHQHAATRELFGCRTQ